MKPTDLLLKLAKLSKKTSWYLKQSTTALEKNDLASLVTIMGDIDDFRHNFIVHFEDSSFVLRAHALVAYDFRMCLSSVLIAEHLDDLILQLKGIISFYLKIKDKAFFNKISYLLKLLNSQIKKITVAISECNDVKAQEIAKNDKLIDKEYKIQTMAIVLSKKINSGDTYFNKLMLLKKLERSGDYITLICNEIYYIRKDRRITFN